MDDTETYMNVQFGRRDAQGPSQGNLDVSYVELNFNPPSQPQAPGGDITSTYSELTFGNSDTAAAAAAVEEEEEEDSPAVPGPTGQPVTAPAVSQLRQSHTTTQQDYQRLWGRCQEVNVTQRQSQAQCRSEIHRLRSALESQVSQISRLNLSERNCLRDTSELSHSLSVQDRMHRDLVQELQDLRSNFTQANNTRAQLCHFINRRRGTEYTCQDGWQINEQQCYYISWTEKDFNSAKKYCSEERSTLLYVNSQKEEEFLIKVLEPLKQFWVGKCRSGAWTTELQFSVGPYHRPSCRRCSSRCWTRHCCDRSRFICRRAARPCLDIPDEIRALCRQPPAPIRRK